MLPRNERGLTLTEVTIVTVLASVVMIGLVGFYLNSQSTWMEASAQAITQRDATALTEAIADTVRRAAFAVVGDSPDPEHAQLGLYEYGASDPFYVYWWDQTDSLIHEGPARTSDRGAMVRSTVERFICVKGDSMVDVTVQLRSPQGQHIEVSTSAAMMNRYQGP